MNLPNATVTILPNGLGIVRGDSDTTVAVLGCSSKGPLLKPCGFANYNLCAQTFGTGIGVKASAYMNAKTGAPFVFIRLPAVAVAAAIGVVDTSGITGNLAPTVSGTPLDAYDVLVIFTTGGTVGQAGILYQVSVDGGETFGAPVALGAATTIALPGTGLTINLPSAQSVNGGDSFGFLTTAASQSILPLTITKVNNSTAAITVSGTPEDAYEVVFQILAGGTVGKQGIVFRYSLDGGRTFTFARQLGTANHVDLLDDAIGGALLSGLTVSFGAGTLDAGDAVAFNTTGPAWQASDAAQALKALKASANKWSFAHVVGDCSVPSAGAIGGTLSGFATNAASPKYTFAVVSARDRGTHENLITWAQRLADAVVNFADYRIAYAAGYARVTCPITGRSNRRSMAWSAVPRIAANGIEIDPGMKALQALSSDTEIHDDDGTLVEHDATQDSTLHAARYMTLRTYAEEKGVYISRGNTMAGPGEDFNRIPYVRVINKAAEIQRTVEQQQLVAPWAANTATQPNPGAVRPSIANRVEREMRTALEAELKGKVSGILVTVDRTTPFKGKAKCDVRLAPLFYVDEFEGTVGFTSPELLAVQAA